MATTTCRSPVFRLSACTTSAGRSLAVRRSEFGKSTSTTSARLQVLVEGGKILIVVVVDFHLWIVPVLKGSKAGAQIRGLAGVDAVPAQVNSFLLSVARADRKARYFCAMSVLIQTLDEL